MPIPSRQVSGSPEARAVAEGLEPGTGTSSGSRTSARISQPQQGQGEGNIYEHSQGGFERTMNAQGNLGSDPWAYAEKKGHSGVEDEDEVDIFEAAEEDIDSL
ncbi:hypothetical protein BJX61DRAFT_544590 [Aspergillus egyptiacus]|nr:hypothetical protein BJX61DRAFT_544590 [Aspergillus egyptiacus]